MNNVYLLYVVILGPKSARQTLYLMLTHVAGVPVDSDLWIIYQVYTFRINTSVLEHITH